MVGCHRWKLVPGGLGPDFPSGTALARRADQCLAFSTAEVELFASGLAVRRWLGLEDGGGALRRAAARAQRQAAVRPTCGAGNYVVFYVFAVASAWIPGCVPPCSPFGFLDFVTF